MPFGATPTENETSPRRDGSAQPFRRRKKTQPNNAIRPRAGSTEPPTHGSPTVPAKSHRRRLKRRAKRGRKPGHGDRCSLRARMRSVTLAPTTIASQTEIPSPFRESKGARTSEASARGMPVQGSGERIPYPADVYPHRRAGEATALTRGENQMMTGADLQTLPGGPTVWRRRRCWTTTTDETTNDYRTRPKPRGDASTTRPDGQGVKVSPVHGGNVQKDKGGIPFN